jgi:hypothetical protein
MPSKTGFDKKAGGHFWYPADKAKDKIFVPRIFRQKDSSRLRIVDCGLRIEISGG